MYVRRKTKNLTNSLGPKGRCVYMCMLPFSFNWQSYHIILNTLPSFFFYSAYFVFLFFCTCGVG